MPDTTQIPLPSPLPYMARMRDLLRSREPDVWEAVANSRAVHADADRVRLDLLKRAYRLSPEGEAEHYDMAADAAARLDVRPAITLYQRGAAESNAALYYIPGEAHIVFQGGLLKQLSPEELRGVIAHELGHYRLYEIEGRSHYHTSRILLDAARHPAAEPVHAVTGARYLRAVELYADRCALAACGALDPVVGGLLKVHADMDKVHVPSYLKQAEEVLSKDVKGAAFVEHPELFIRARALALWLENPEGCEPEIQHMLEGEASLEKLDLLQQAELAEITERFITALLSPAWLRSDAVLGHVRMALPTIAPGAATLEDALPALRAWPEAFQSYFHYLMLDVAAADPELNDAPMAWMLTVADRAGWLEDFEKLARKELNQTKKKLMDIFKNAEKIASAAAAQHERGDANV